MAQDTDNQDLERIEHDIEETRARMDHTVDVLREKFSPARLRARAMQRLRPPEQAVSAVRESVRRNPMLYSLLAAAVAWQLVTAAARPSRADLERARAAAAAEGYRRGLADRQQPLSAAGQAARRYLQRMRRSSGELGHKLQGRLQGRAQRVEAQLEDRWDEWQPQRSGSMLPGLIGSIAGAAIQAWLAPRAGKHRQATRAGHRPTAEKIAPERETLRAVRRSQPAPGTDRGRP